MLIQEHVAFGKIGFCLSPGGLHYIIIMIIIICM